MQGMIPGVLLIGLVVCHLWIDGELAVTANPAEAGIQEAARE